MCAGHGGLLKQDLIFTPCRPLPAGGQVKDHEEFNPSAAGEPISVAVTFNNPLQVKLRLTQVGGASE